MALFEHSLEANNIINLFYGVELVVYVEGEDDIPFWEEIFKKTASFSVKVEDVGGKNNLPVYIDQVLSGAANFIVARDSDFDRITGADVKHPRVIYTYGYSIENTIITEHTISKLIKNICRLPRRDVPEQKIKEWLSHLKSQTESLVIFDVKNHLNALGKSVVTDNCDRFMKSKKSYEICSMNIEQHLAQLGIELNAEHSKEIKMLLEKENISSIDMLRGHFFMSASHRFIKRIIEILKKDVSISRDMLFSSLMTAFEVEFDTSHPHYNFYSEKIKLIS